MEVHGSHTVKAWLGGCWTLLCQHVRWMQLCSSLNILWHCLSLGLEWKLTFSSPVTTAEFSKFAGMSAALSQHHLEIAQLEFHHLHYLCLFVVMLPKAHLTSHSRMSGSRWVITPLWLSGSWRSFLCNSSVYSCHLFFISSTSVLYCAYLCKKCSLDISNFLEEISSPSHSIVFFYFFALITEEDFLISPCYLWNSAFKLVYLSFSTLPFASLFFTAIYKASSVSHFALFISFSWVVLIPASCTTSWTSVLSSSGTLSIRSNPLNLFVTSTV